MKGGHEWVPRVPKPKRCPKCLSYDWDKEVGRIPQKLRISSSRGRTCFEDNSRLCQGRPGRTAGAGAPPVAALGVIGLVASHLPINIDEQLKERIIGRRQSECG